MTEAMFEMFCPRCDRKYTGKNKEELELRVRNHVALQHPDHDPDWGKDA